MPLSIVDAGRRGQRATQPIDARRIRQTEPRPQSTILRPSLLILAVWVIVLPGCAGPARSTDSSMAAVAATSAQTQERVSVKRSRRRSGSERVRKNLPNILLYNQDNEPVRFYDDLVKDKIVLIYFMFTTCQGICPATTANVVKMQDLLGDRFGRDIFFISVTLTPKIDTPEVLKAYAEQYGAKPGWSFVTGDKDEIEMLRRKLGIYDPDPIVDADLYSHAGLVTFGNEATGRWAALPGTMKPEQVVDAMLRITRTRR